MLQMRKQQVLLRVNAGYRDGVN